MRAKIGVECGIGSGIVSRSRLKNQHQPCTKENQSKYLQCNLCPRIFNPSGQVAALLSRESLFVVVLVVEVG